MTVDHQPWFHRWYARIRHESTFLPKRLVLITSLLFVLYVVLLLRSEFGARPFGLGLVDAALQSKLIADYDQFAGPAVPFAPLQLAIIEAKIRDENPYLSEVSVTSLVQAAIAAASAPIVTTTPTPHLYTRGVLHAAILVSGTLALSKPVATVTPLWTSGGITSESENDMGLMARISMALFPPTYLRDPNANGVNAVALSPDTMVRPVNTPLALPSGTIAQPSQPSSGSVAFVPLPAAPNGAPEESALNQALIPGIATELPTLIPLAIATTADLAIVAVIQEATVAPISATDPAIAVIQPTSQPLFVDTVTPTPFVDSSALVAATPTSWPSPTQIPLPTQTPASINTPTATWTATSFVSVIATPTATPMPTVAMTPTATITPTSTPIAFVPLTTTDPPIGMATMASTSTTIPTPTATPSPTISSTATPTIAAPPIIINLTAHVENDKVYLAWSPSLVAGVVGYQLYRSSATSVGIGERVNSTLLVETAYVDTVVLDGSQYAYSVTAINQWNLESLPGTAVIVTLADQVAPRTPIQFSASLNGSQIQLRWQANEEPDLAGYNVYSSNRLPIDTTAGPANGATLLATPAYLDTIVLDGQTYYYSFTAVDRAGNESLPSIEAQMPTIDLVAPAPPTGLQLTLQGTTAVVEWQANQETDIAGYRLYRALAIPVDLTMSPLHSEPLLTTLRYDDQNLQPGSLYYYVLVAVDVHQNRSAPSAAVTFP